MKVDEAFWRHMKVVVTGGSGFVGRWILRALASASAKVYVLDITPPAGLEKMCTFQQTDLRDLRTTTRLLDLYKPEVLIHLAGQAGVPACHKDPIDAFESNVLCTLNVLEACRSHGKLKSIVAVSSNHVYGEQKTMPTSEDAPLDGVGIYATSKLCGDVIARAYAKTYGLPVSIARITNSYGGDDPHITHIVTSSILCALKGETPVIRQSGRDTKGYLYVKDTVNGILMLAAQTVSSAGLYGEAFNFAPDSPISAKDLVDEVIAAVDRDFAAIIEKPMAAHEVEHLDNSKARCMLGWNPRYTLRAGLTEAIMWYRDHSG